MLASCLAVAILGSAFLVTVVAQGLEHGSQAWYGGPDARITTARSTTEVAHVFAPGARFTFGTSVHNPGPWPVTIVRIGTGEVFATVDVKVVRPQALTVASGPDAAQPFTRVTVPAGAEFMAFVTVAAPTVEMGTGTTTYFGELTVTYEIFGLARRDRIPIGFDVGVYVPDSTAPQ